MARLHMDIVASLSRAREALPDPDEAAALLKNVSGWDLLERLLIFHNAAAIVLSSLIELELTDLVPESFLERLREVTRSVSARNLLHKRTLSGVLEAMNREGADIVLYKGSALAEFAYPKPSHRPMTDIDFMIRPTDAEKVEQLMFEMGFMPEDRRKRSRQWWMREFQHLEPFLTPDKRVRMEAHLRNARPGSPYEIGVEPMWGWATPVQYGKADVLVMIPEDALLFQIMHLYIHDLHACRIIDLCDLDRILRSAEGAFDWNRFAKAADSERVGALCHLPLTLARDLLKAPVPREILDRTRPEDLDAGLLPFLTEYVLREDAFHQMVPPGAARALDQPGFAGRIKVLIGHLFPSSRVIAEKYELAFNSPLIWLMRLIHPFSVVKRYWRFGLSLVRGESREKKLLELTRTVQDCTSRRGISTG